ncbi:hypothetical protein [Roseateles sp.]|uniref:hypothetical protein n=1 Tax=Roseateles sp. TaxID=1971397 RepID=UPI002E022091|nr:hypothetical protein [Roseateles sp.]
MTTTTWPVDPRRIADPFGERAPLALSRRYGLLGATFDFLSDSPELLALVDAAYGGLPAHELDGPTLRVELRLAEDDAAFTAEPPRPRMLGGAGLVGATVDAHNLVIVLPEAGRAAVQLSRSMLGFGYHARYELIEFAVFQLAARTQGLVALHAGCVGLDGVGALLMGVSGAGKSTLTLHAALQGLDFLTEDGSFVEPRTLRATGVANFLHLRFDALAWIDDAAVRARAQASPVIRRRSGVEKFELDLRGGWVRLAAQPLRLRHLVFASPEPDRAGALLRALSTDELLERLHGDQAYAMGQPGWPSFVQGCRQLHGWVLARGTHPAEGAAALRSLLMG